MNFFYGPYNSFYNVKKCMKFDDKHILSSVANNWELIVENVLQIDEVSARYFWETFKGFQDEREQ